MGIATWKIKSETVKSNKITYVESDDLLISS